MINKIYYPEQPYLLFSIGCKPSYSKYRNIISTNVVLSFASLVMAINIIKITCKLTIGLIKRSYLGGFRVNPSPTYVALVTILFQAFP